MPDCFRHSLQTMLVEVEEAIRYVQQMPINLFDQLTWPLAMG